MKYGKKRTHGIEYSYWEYAKFVGIGCDPVVAEGWEECDDPGCYVKRTYFQIGDLRPVLRRYESVLRKLDKKRQELNALVEQQKDLISALEQNVTEPTICGNYYLGWDDEDFEIKKGKSV